MPGFFSNTLAVLRREIYRVARQPMYWLLTVILPIVAFAFFAVLLYKGVARDIPIAVVDQDNSTLSRKVTQMITRRLRLGSLTAYREWKRPND